LLVVDEDQFVAGRRIGQADAARARTVGDPAHGALRCEFVVGQREQVLELARFEAANAEMHGCLRR